VCEREREREREREGERERERFDLRAAHVSGPEGLVRREERVSVHMIYMYMSYT